MRDVPILADEPFLKSGPVQTLYAIASESAAWIYRRIVEKNPEVKGTWADLEPSAVVGDRGNDDERGEKAGPDDVETEEFFARHEGRAVWSMHRERERRSDVIEMARVRAAREPQGLACRACGFDFEATYGAVGEGFIEVRHAVPLSTYSDDGQLTRIEDLVVLCSNCHRMVHRRRPWLLVGQLKSLLAR